MRIFNSSEAVEKKADVSRREMTTHDSEVRGLAKKEYSPQEILDIENKKELDVRLAIEIFNYRWVDTPVPMTRGAFTDAPSGTVKGSGMIRETNWVDEHGHGVDISGLSDDDAVHRLFWFIGYAPFAIKPIKTGYRAYFKPLNISIDEETLGRAVGKITLIIERTKEQLKAQKS